MSLEMLVGLAALFASVALLTGMVTARALALAAPGRRRLREVVQPARRTPDAAPGLTVTTSSGWSRVARFVPKSPAEMNRLQRRLARAGYTEASAPIIYGLGQVLIPAVLALTVLAVMGFANRNAWLLAGFAVVIGLMTPSMVVERKIALRRKQVRNGLPDMLDLLIVCLEAGSSLDQAIVKTADELAISYPVLAQELRLLNIETRAGKPRLEAFKNLAQRTRVDDVRALVAMLVQTDRFGTSVSQALRTFASSLRVKRRQIAEEKAAKVGVKLVFPLVLFLFPAFYVVVLGPAIIQFIRVFFGQIMQHVSGL